MSSAAGLLMGMHAIIAAKRSEPHWMLNDADARRYGAALSNALRHMPVQTSQKAIDFGALLFCAFEMESPRVMRSVMIEKAKAAQASADQVNPAARHAASVFQFRKPATSERPATPVAQAAQPAPGGQPETSPPIAEGPPDGRGFGGEV